MNANCDNRDFKSIGDRDNRDIFFRGIRENNRMTSAHKEIRDWMQDQLQRMGRGAKGKLAAHLGIRADGVTRMLNDEPGKEARRIHVDEVAKMAEFFGVAPPALELTPATSAPQSVKVIGKVAANTWMDVDNMDFSYDDVTEVPVVGSISPSLQFGLVVEGNCLNKIADNGDILVCVDTMRAHYSPRENDLVIVERRRYGGQMIQRTAKRLRQTSEGYELWPESTDPAHQEPIRLPATLESGEEVDIIGKVLWIMRRP